MDDPQQKLSRRKRNPKERANFFSKLFFFYVFKLIRKGFRHELEEDDLYETPKDLKSKFLGDRLEKFWANQKSRSFARLFWKAYIVPYLLLGLTQFITVALSILRPQLIGQFIAYFVPGQTHLTKNDAWIYGSSLIIINFLDSLYHQHYTFQVVTLGIKAKAAVGSFIYRQVLKAGPGNLENIPIGKIITFMTTDVATFQFKVLLFNSAWADAVKILILCVILYYKIGLSCLVMLLSFVIIIPLESCVLHFASKVKVRVCKRTDERLSILKESLSAIRVIKMYIWEKFFQSKIANARKFVFYYLISYNNIHFYRKELSLLFRLNFLHLVNLLILNMTEHVVLFLMIVSQVWSGKSLAAETTFYIINISHILGYFVRVCIPYATINSSQLMAAFRRIGGVLELMEEKKTCGDSRFRNRYNLNKGLTVVSGINGSGKSVFLKNIIEDCKSSKEKVSYAAQEPWLFPSTIRQNILFVEEYEEKRYKEVLRVCALLYDLEDFENGDETIVADRAINLSRGQQSRINLARAIYRQSEIYLLDDIFTSLDTSVSAFIFQECIMNFLKDKTVVLVSNDSKYYNKVSCIIVMQDGDIKSWETYSPNPQKLQIEESYTLVEDDAKSAETGEDEKSPLIRPNTSKPSNIYREIMKTGKVNFGVYTTYIKSGGGYLLFIVLVLMCGFIEFIASYKSKYLSQWVNFQLGISKMEQENATSSTKYQDMLLQSKTMQYIHGASVLALCGIFFAHALLNFCIAKRASLNLHKHMTNTIVNSRMTFFDTTFLGNILNRFSNDFQIIDQQTPLVILQISRISCEIFGIVALIILVNKMFLIPSIIFVLLLVITRHIYLRTARNLRRLHLATRSPVIGYLNATINGLTTVRAFNAEDILQNEFDGHQDLNTSASFIYECCACLFVLTIDCISMSFITIIILRFLLQSDKVLVGGIGLALTQAMRLVHKLPWGIYQWTELETQMTSIERVIEYTETETENRQGLVLRSWPAFGSVKFENVCLRYAKSNVFKNVNFTVNPMEKFAIVGRTGAGKSSIISSLFRLYKYEGNILIDGVDIKTLSLDFLRSNIAVIPQDPHLFQGSIRDNLDPLHNHTDEEIWKALEITNLKKQIDDLSKQTDDLKLSVGQRQRIYLTIVLLSRNRIVVFDEAVEDVDSETELLIRTIIDEYFDYCTLITIAHRLEFIRNFDRVLVLSQGDILELGAPSELLMIENGALASLMAKSK